MTPLHALPTMMRDRRLTGLRLLSACILAGGLAACAPFPQSRLELETADRRAQDSDTAPAPADARTATAPAGQGAGDNGPKGFYEPGSDRFLSGRSGPPTTPSPGPAEGGVTLNFENTSLLEVVKVVLSDLLGRSYVLDPAVQGTVTLQSSTPISREALLPTLELLLRMNGAAVVDDGTLVHVLPREKAVKGTSPGQLGDSSVALPKGYAIRVVPLRYIGVEEMREILEPLSDPGSVVRADTRRNLLILAGSRSELEQILDTVSLFDVDWMAGMSVALFRPDFVAAKTLAEELEAILGTEGKGTLDGLVRLVVIERLNGLLVVTPRREYLARVREWVARLDQSSGGVGERLFVYHVQNGKAAELAEVLNQVFESEERADQVPPAELAPGLKPAELASREEPRADQAAADQEQPAPGREAPAPARAAAPRAEGIPSVGAGVALNRSKSIRIIADEVNNALLILASAEDYKQVEAALRQLDLAPLQVLIEATIAEVRLEDQLSQGLEWFFKNSVGSKRGTATLDLNDTAGLAAVVPGFSYAITDSAAVVRAVLNTLATESRAKIISSPSLMVLNNQKATIQVGDQVPITTQQQQATTTTSNIVNSIEFRDTGVLLSVTPRVNTGGLVIMEVEQEVSNVAPNAANTLTPTIQQRKINSTVAVQSGETVVLGGLIRENDNATGSGIPGLREVPVLGWFFGSSTDELTRSELVVLITPRAVRGANQAREVTEEFRRKMDSLRPGTTPRRGFGPLHHKTDKLRGLPEGASPRAAAPRADSEKERVLTIDRTLDPGRPSRPTAEEPGPAVAQAPASLALKKGF